MFRVWTAGIRPRRHAGQAHLPHEALYPLAIDGVTRHLEEYDHLAAAVEWVSSILPDNGPSLRRLMGDGELSLAFSFWPAEVPAAIANNELPPTVESYVLDGGTIGNVSFLAIPFNAQHKSAAMVVANFLLSPEAQAYAQHPDNWGFLTVLSMDQLDAEQKALFEAIPLRKGGVTLAELQQVLEEPHASWVEALETAWLERYSGN